MSCCLCGSGNDTGKDSDLEAIRGGVGLPPITENPHLEKLDEQYSKCQGHEIREITITQIQSLFTTGKLTSKDLTECYMQRIEHLDKVLKSVIEVNPDAVKDAIKADEEREKGDIKGPLHGIPILLKDNICTADLMKTTAGSMALVGLRPKSDADVVTALRKAGAVILGKANLSEFAFFRGTNIPSGWSSRGGQTRNPYNLNVTPEGSSSGSAVAVAANLAAASLGTETDGSLIAPASICGICTLKPTHGMPSIKGIIPLSSTQDHVGPMARTVTDLAILLDGMLPVEKRHKSHPASFLDAISQKSKPFRVGVMRYPFFSKDCINSTNLEHEMPQLELILDTLKKSPLFEIVDEADSSPSIDLMKNISQEKELQVLYNDFKHDLNEFLANEILNDPTTTVSEGETHQIKTLKDIIDFNRKHPSPECYNQELLEKSENSTGISSAEYQQAVKSNREAAKAALNAALRHMDAHRLDAVVTPSESRYDGIMDKQLTDSAVLGYSVAAISGYPSINIPVGIGLKDVPFGLTFIGEPYSEAKLLQIGYAAEKLLRKRSPPKFFI